MPGIVEFTTGMIGAEALYLPDARHRFVEVLSDPAFAPTHWGGDPPRKRFDRKAFEENIRPGHMFICARRAAPKWEGFGEFPVRYLQDCSLRFQVDAPDDLRQEVFRWIDALADAFQPEWGYAHCPIKNASIELYGYSMKPETYLACGPGCLPARAYIGNRIADLIGRDVLAGLAARVVDKGWGVVVDLIDKPWACSKEKLRKRQLEVLPILRSTGIFGEYTQRPFLPEFVKPGPRWVPPDLSKMPKFEPAPAAPAGPPSQRTAEDWDAAAKKIPALPAPKVAEFMAKRLPALRAGLEADHLPTAGSAISAATAAVEAGWDPTPILPDLPLLMDAALSHFHATAESLPAHDVDMAIIISDTIFSLLGFVEECLRRRIDISPVVPWLQSHSDDPVLGENIRRLLPPKPAERPKSAKKGAKKAKGKPKGS